MKSRNIPSLPCFYSQYSQCLFHAYSLDVSSLFKEPSVKQLIIKEIRSTGQMILTIVPPGCVPEACNDCACEACSSCPYYCAGLSGPMEGTAAWHSPTTENPALGDMEEWWIYNFSADAHPIHLHLVHMQVMERKKFKWASNTDEDGVCTSSPCEGGIGLEPQKVVQHMGALGDGYKAVLPVGANWTDDSLYEPYTNTTNPDLNWIYEEAR